ncbi:phosphomannomutase/phosphoglucomutase, partial [Glaciimonas sp. CA11.2]
MITLSPTLFKAYDIRGIVGQTLDASIAYDIGRAFGAAVLAQGEHAAIVGRDGRLSGPELSTALVNGLQSTGVTVIDLGVVTTPMVYYATNVLSTTSGIMVTGSHNPADHNGFKMVLGGEAIYGDTIQLLYQAICDQAIVKSTAQPKEPEEPGQYRPHDIKDYYLKRITSNVKLQRPMKIAIDCGNGVAGAFAAELYRAMGCEVIELFCEVDGRFPNHHPDPADPKNLQDLIRCLSETDAEIGLAFDGDGDRLGVVTKDGQIIYPDRQLMLFAKDVLTR